MHITAMKCGVPPGLQKIRMPYSAYDVDKQRFFIKTATLENRENEFRKAIIPS
jgi:hypothetical protein